jgi:hypothetical protein
VSKSAYNKQQKNMIIKVAVVNWPEMSIAYFPIQYTTDKSRTREKESLLNTFFNVSFYFFKLSALKLLNSSHCFLLAILSTTSYNYIYLKKKKQKKKQKINVFKWIQCCCYCSDCYYIARSLISHILEYV